LRDEEVKIYAKVFQGDVAALLKSAQTAVALDVTKILNIIAAFLVQ